MDKGYIYIYHGEGRGKTTIAIGQGIRAVSSGLKVIMIQFLDYNNTKEATVLKKLEPDFNVFRFEKIRDGIESFDESIRKEIKNEIHTAFNFTKKIFDTGECDLLILDGIIEAINQGYISKDDFLETLSKKQGFMSVILTGTQVNQEIMDMANFVYVIQTEKKTT
ncbi:MAG: cob(I)yrinic acid a,c-diamide adenosyltransferase [Lachnospiraceae bacterium]|nr:cob(I)yrinic acid a,c-diamide adenosyltransferase [Lachnospiraceae bacterium]